MKFGCVIDSLREAKDNYIMITGSQRMVQTDTMFRVERQTKSLLHSKGVSGRKVKANNFWKKADVEASLPLIEDEWDSEENFVWSNISEMRSEMKEMAFRNA